MRFQINAIIHQIVTLCGIKMVNIEVVGNVFDNPKLLEVSAARD